jgi:predicted ArsR family transcriptional regulator
MPNWLETLKGETQAKLLYQLRRSSQTITELADHLELTDNAVRTHIAVLEREGLVEPAGMQRDTGGKPARRYALTRLGEELFPKAYALVLGELIEEISRRDGLDGAIAMLQMVGRRVGSAAAEGRKPEERVAAAAGALRELGGEVGVERDGGGWLIRGMGCPLSAVTQDHPETCALAKAMIEEITGMAVTECCERSGRPRCGFKLAASPGPG